MRLTVLLRSQRLIEGVLPQELEHMRYTIYHGLRDTITRITTQGKFKDLTISMATEVLPEPELPAIPMMLRSCHGGEYFTPWVSE